MNLPDDSQRHLIIGRTGSGKTTFGIHTLSLRSYDEIPWVLLNFKRDKLMNRIPATEMGDVMVLPEAKKFVPGLYMYRPDPEDIEGMENFFLEIWRRGQIGIYIDELLCVSEPRVKKVRRLLTQGRSLETPIIGCTQRCSGIDRYFFTESEYINVFKLSDDREKETLIDAYGKAQADMNFNSLPKYYSYCIDRVDYETIPTSPAPDIEEIIQTFHDRVKKSSPSRFLL